MEKKDEKWHTTKKRKQTKMQMQMHKCKTDEKKNQHSQIAYQFHLENLCKS